MYSNIFLKKIFCAEKSLTFMDELFIILVFLMEKNNYIKDEKL